MKKFPLLILIIISALTIFQFSCHSPTEPNNNISISLEDVSCTEAWIKVTGETGSQVILNRDDKEVQKFTLTSSPQTIYDDSLLPNKTYTYHAVQNNKTSNKITAKTLDTTSSNFTFQTIYLGGASSSVLNDVAIINDTLAYAVGQIYEYDSTGQIDQYPYNLATWNGQNWKLSKLYAGGFPPAIKSVYAFNLDDVWFDP